jgi:hypothetical protein
VKILDITVIGDEEVKRYMRNLTPKMEAELRRAVSNTARVMEGDAKKFTPVDQGRLRSSIYTEYDSDGLGATVRPSLTPIDIVMEMGRKPGSRMPPVSALIPWVHRHHMTPRIRAKNVFVMGRNVGREAATNAYDRNVRSIAFLIARSIARKGTRPRRYMQLAADRAELNWRVNVQRAVERGMQ